MTEPLDPFERRVADSLHGRRPDVTPDVVGARAVFLERRRRREKKRKLLALAASGSTALTITLIALVLSVGGTGSPADTLGLAGGSPEGSAPPSPRATATAEPSPGGAASTEEPAPGESSTTGPTAKPSPAQPHPDASHNAGGGTVTGSPAATSYPSPSPSSSCSTDREVSAGNSADCYVLHVGETLRVSYDESYWSDPETSDDSVLKTGAKSHVQCVRAPCYGTMQDFDGQKVGTAKLSAYGDPCKNNPPDQPMCGAPVQLWEITVHVIM